MQCQNEDLWGPVPSHTNRSGTDPLGFEDSFSPPQATSAGGGSHQLYAESDYIPLEDSSQYLAGLERKLACVQGRSDVGRQTESSRLIDALATTREDHAHHLMNTPNNVGTDSDVIEPDSDHSTSFTAATVDPQGALGAMLRRVAPNKVALAPEELCRLLEADILAKAHEALDEEALAPHLPVHQSKTSLEECCNEAVKSADNGTEINLDKTKSPAVTAAKSPFDLKEPSSDEGEK